MTRRSKILILIIVGILLLLLGLYIFFRPFLVQRTGPPAQPPTPAGGTPYVPSAPAQGQPTAGGATTTQPAQADDLLALEHAAKAAAGRVGSGSNENGFLGYQDEYYDATPSYRATLLSDMAAMQKLHPATGPLYSISTFAASASSNDTYGDPTIVMQVQARQTVTAGNAAPVTTSKKVDVTFQRQSDGSYLVDDIQWSDLQL